MLDIQLILLENRVNVKLPVLIIDFKDCKEGIYFMFFQSYNSSLAGCLASISQVIFICMVGTNQGFSGYSRQKSFDSPKQISKKLSIVLCGLMSFASSKVIQTILKSMCLTYFGNGVCNGWVVHNDYTERKTGKFLVQPLQ